MEKSRKVADLTDTEIIEELTDVDKKIDAEYSILSVLRSRKKEVQDEINRRFKEDKIMEEQ